MNYFTLKSQVRILFFGIYDIGAKALSELRRTGKNIVGVVSKPSHALNGQPVACLASRYKIPLLQPDSLSDSRLIFEISQLRPDLIVVAGYHRRIPKAIIELPRIGIINLHGSLLPEYRGPCTWKWAIINGERDTGVTVHFLTEAIDCGDIIAQKRIPITLFDTGGSLYEKICNEGAFLLNQAIAEIAENRIRPKPQREDSGSYFGQIRDEDARIKWEDRKLKLTNLIRALCPRPGAWAMYDGHRLRIWTARPADGLFGGRPGTILAASSEGITVAVADGALRVTGISWDSGDGTGNGVAPAWCEFRVGDVLA